MLIELNTLPVEIRQQVMQVQQGVPVSFAENGKIVANIISPTQDTSKKFISAYDRLMAFDFPEGIEDIEFEPMPKYIDNRIRELD